MKEIMFLLFAILSVSGCNPQDEKVYEKNHEMLGVNEEMNWIGEYKIKSLESIVFEHSFTKPQWIGFLSDISLNEIERFEETCSNPFCFSIEIKQIGSKRYVGSHTGAAVVFSPLGKGIDKFEIFNNSRENLVVKVYWEEE